MAPGRGLRGMPLRGEASGNGPRTRAHHGPEDTGTEEPMPAVQGFNYAAMAAAFRACRQMEDMEANAARAEPTADELAAEAAEQAAVQEEKEAERWLKLSEIIVKICPKEFLGTEGAIAARRWIQEIDRHLEILHCTPSERIRLAVYHLSGDARSWWDSCIRHQGRDALYASTWDEFVLLFERKYVPAYEKARLKEQYENLVQGSMTVEQYYREFDHLSYYGSTETELDRVVTPPNSEVIRVP